MNDNSLDNIQALKAKQKKTELSSEEIARLRAEVKKIAKRQEEEEKARRRAEMERLYELGLYA